MQLMQIVLRGLTAGIAPCKVQMDLPGIGNQISTFCTVNV